MRPQEDVCELVPVTKPHRKAPIAIIVLVHGTGAREAEWTKQESCLCKAISRPNYDIYRFLWSGDNSHDARLTAAESFKEKLTELIEQPRYESARLYIVAHSHGGNVSLYGMSGMLKERVSGVICLATPFLHFYKTAPETKWLFGLASMVAIPLLVLVVAAILEGAFALSKIPLAVVIVSAVLVLAFLFRKLRKAGFRLPIGKVLRVMFKEDIEAMVKKLKLPELEWEKLLIVRPVADEAAGVLTSAQFAAWVGRQVWRTLGRIWRVVPSAIAAFGLVAWGLGFFLNEMHAEQFDSIGSLIVGIILFGLGAVALLIIFVIVLANAPFGYDALALAFRGQTAAEDSPPGKAVVYQVALSGFRHSEIYKAEKVIEQVKKFIQSADEVRGSDPTEISKGNK